MKRKEMACACQNNVLVLFFATPDVPLLRSLIFIGMFSTARGRRFLPVISGEFTGKAEVSPFVVSGESYIL
ncbi:hypothetical protein INT08_00655 [Prosthecochloris sp. N3]|uniref:Uncharacterized protein n=1 Tax=Prosthecochloris ethylica TaxID=2743976 RepID=A0ABR9XNS6_9CHLB|nr:hypothetical protein [Prosthecochloris ethylica]MBF0585781.1 hypothetical protein [Prosthecochloris ethylica]MBF0635691.1 hypothetical protein [Prosthecochloris ethylica]NUK46990.1 hypothetical protein [Prosthecochloris ethylica]